MFTVKISPHLPELLRQSPGGSGIWGNYRFVTDPALDRCDLWVVFDGLMRSETVRCPVGATLLITGEPPSFKRYAPRFVAQFGTVLTCQHEIRHRRRILRQQALPWHIGRRQLAHQTLGFTNDYDRLRSLRSFPKSRRVSVITSDKTLTPGHQRRLDFVNRLRAHFGDRLDVFGRGLCEIEDKWDAIAPYEYHITLENNVVPDYWTEKLADAFLGGAYPLYAGCPNIHDYFPRECLRVLDYDDPDSSIAIIEECLSSDVAARSRDAILAARDLVLDRYNFFPTVVALAERLVRPDAQAAPTTLRPEADLPPAELPNWFSRARARCGRWLRAG
jgi:hypothetical protein